MLRHLFFGALIGVVVTTLVGFASWKYSGYVAVSAASYAAYKGASAAIDKIKQRNVAKKSDLKQKTAKKAGKRLGTAVIAAGTIGTVAVVGVSTSFLIEDHCEGLREIYELDALTNDQESPFDYAVCLAETKTMIADWSSEAVSHGKEQWREILTQTAELTETSKELMPKWPWFSIKRKNSAPFFEIQ
jgi:hypothetical protein